MSRTSPLHPYWYGYLCRENAEHVAEHLRRMFYGRAFTFVACADREGGRCDPETVAASCVLTAPIEMTVNTIDGHEYVHIRFTTTRYSQGLNTEARTEQDAREGLNTDRCFLRFEGDYKLTIELWAPCGDRLVWTFAIEDHEQLRQLIEYRETPLPAEVTT